MKRKLVKQGTSTLMISLPSKWIHINNLSKGSEVELEQLDDNLIISSRPISIKLETTINLSESTETYVRTLITNTYRRGYDKIKIFYNNQEQFEILLHIIKTRLIGFDIIKKEQNYCIVENITEPDVSQFDNIMRKMFFGISELFEEIKKRFENKTKNPNDIDEIAERIQKYDNFCRRVIMKQKITSKNTELLWAFLTLMIHGQREIYLISKINFKNTTISSKTKDFLNDIKQLYETLVSIYLNKDAKLVAKIHIQNDMCYKKGLLLLQNSQGKETLLTHHLLSAGRIFYQANSPIVGLII